MARAGLWSALAFVLDWPASRPWMGGVIVVLGAIAFTAWSEWYNVYRAGNWGYKAGMPMIFGIGLAPLLRWLILPAGDGGLSNADAHHSHQQA